MIERISQVWKVRRYGALIAGILITTSACTQKEESFTKVKAPLHNYSITSRLDNKQAGTTSEATAVLKGTYSEATKILTYTLTFDVDSPVSIRIDKGARGSLGIGTIEVPKESALSYKSPVSGGITLTSLEERDMLRGLWFMSIESAKFQPYEIRGRITIKQL